MIRAVLTAFLLGTATLAAPHVQAATFFTATLDGSQEEPERETPGIGTGTAVYDGTRFLDVSMSWSGLLAPAVAAHIHCCPGPGANGPVAIDFVPAGFPNVAAGTFEDSFDLDAAASYGEGFLDSFGGDVGAAKSAFLGGLFAELAYFNIHTSVFPGGEIRGDITIPAPGAVALLGLGVIALGVGRRRRG